MLNVLQTFRKNTTMPFVRRSTLLLLLATVFVFAEGCSRKMPCPDTSKATKQAKSTKKKKVEAKPQAPADGDDNAEASAASTTPAEEESSGSAAKTKISVKKNRYNKNGLLTKNKYKRLRSNPARKTSRVKQGFFSKLFSGNKTKKKSKSKSSPVTE